MRNSYFRIFSLLSFGEFQKAHENSCFEYGDEQQIIDHSQFIHVELSRYWRDEYEVFAQFLAEFFRPNDRGEPWTYYCLKAFMLVSYIDQYYVNKHLEIVKLHTWNYTYSDFHK